jgi:hypothetical protein
MNIKCLFIIFIIPLVVLGQVNVAPKKSFGILYGPGISFNKCISLTSFELFVGPGLKKSTCSRWSSQVGIIYNSIKYHCIIDDYALREGINEDRYYDFAYTYGRYFHISEKQGIYTYTGAALGLSITGVNNNDPFYLPDATPLLGINYRYSILISDIKMSLRGIVVSFGLTY